MNKMVTVGVVLAAMLAMVGCEKVERERFKLRYGFLADVLFVSEDVKAGTALTKDKLQCHDYVGMGVSDRCLQAGDLKSVLGRKVAFDLKRGSILLKTDLCEEAAQK